MYTFILMAMMVPYYQVLSNEISSFESLSNPCQQPEHDAVSTIDSAPRLRPRQLSREKVEAGR